MKIPFAFKVNLTHEKHSLILSHYSAAICVFSSSSLGPKPGLTDFMVKQIKCLASCVMQQQKENQLILTLHNTSSHSLGDFSVVMVF